MVRFWGRRHVIKLRSWPQGPASQRNDLATAPKSDHKQGSGSFIVAGGGSDVSHGLMPSTLPVHLCPWVTKFLFICLVSSSKAVCTATKASVCTLAVAWKKLSPRSCCALPCLSLGCLALPPSIHPSLPSWSCDRPTLPPSLEVVWPWVFPYGARALPPSLPPFLASGLSLPSSLHVAATIEVCFLACAA